MWVFRTFRALQCQKCRNYFNNKKINTRKKSNRILLVPSLRFQHFRQLLQNTKLKPIASFSSNQSLDLYLTRFLGPWSIWLLTIANGRIRHFKTLLMKKCQKHQRSSCNFFTNSKNLMSFRILNLEKLERVGPIDNRPWTN